MKKNYTKFCWIPIIFSLAACTKQPEPVVTELDVVPKTFSINSPSSLTKPFTVRARFSDNKIENVTQKVHWISENSALIEVSANGELLPKKACEIPVCIISLVVTHPESGKSQRVEVKLYPEKKTEKVDKKAPVLDSESTVDEREIEKNVNDDKSSETANDANDDPIDVASKGTSSSTLPTETQVERNVEQSTNDTTDSLISISFRNSSQQLISGQLLEPEVVSDPNSIVQPVNYLCEIEYTDEDAVVLENGCNIRALAPGKVRIKLVVSNPQYVTNSILDLEILALEIQSGQVNSLNFILEQNQSQIWLKLLGVIPGETIRYSVKGLFNHGFQFFVLNSLQDNRGACFNTAPADSDEVACIVSPLFSEIYLVLYKPQAGKVMANISASVLPAEIMAYSKANSADNPQDLLKDNKIRSYILANEFGLYNRHFYAFTPGLGDQNGFRIILTEYDAEPLIEIFWANGFCADKMLKVTNNSVYCDIPADRVGDVWITVSGNVGAGTLNSPVAKKGGTYYSLLVTNKENQ